jgi:prepilin-type N-terminal cleavage/methylation domain-containing protein
MKSRAFTLIELLIVVAIIAILAAIAVPNFLEAQTSSRVSRVQNDMRTIALGCEAYMVDNSQYPCSLRDSPIPGGNRIAHMDLRLISTPVAYVDYNPQDVFRLMAGSQGAGAWRAYSHRYGTGGALGYPRNAWMTWSFGPDIISQTGGYRSYRTVLANEALAKPDLGTDTPPRGTWGTGWMGMRYDPTNGTKGIGDIYRWSPLAKVY